MSQAQRQSEAARERAQALQNTPTDAAPLAEETAEAALAAARASYERLRSLNLSYQTALSQAQREAEAVRERSAEEAAVVAVEPAAEARAPAGAAQ